MDALPPKQLESPCGRHWQLALPLENVRCFRHTGGVKWTYFFALLLTSAILAGCNQAATNPPVTQSVTNASGIVVPVDSLPTEAQPKLQTMKIYLGPETLDAEMALTRDEEETGLMYRTNITDDTAMIFVLPQPMVASFWMTNCPMSLSCAYIGPDGVFEEIHHLEKNDCVPVYSTNNNITFVLEVNDGWFARHNIGAGTLIRTERGSLPQTFR